jgi:glycosyltransferase involved in cell wall biosynthesis
LPKQDSVKKIAIVVQRYGLEVNGGAEYHARILAEQLACNYQVTILTTTALDYQGWKNHYPAGETVVNGIPVVRFATITSSRKSLRKARRAISGNKKYFRLLKQLGLFRFFEKHFKLSEPTQQDVDNWLMKQGPYCPEMMTYIKAHEQAFDAFIFFTYLYYPTAKGMPLVADKSIFIPTAHDEPIMFTKPYEDIYAVPRFIMYNTLSEKRLVESRFKNVCPQADIAGVGIDAYPVPEHYAIKPELSFDFPYFVYIGRIEASKGCGDLIELFGKFAKQHPDVKLVMIGKDFMDIKPGKQVVMTGFIEEVEKYYLLQNSLGLILPSKYESLSMVTLEAMMAGKQVVVNEKCEVLKDHIVNSGTGYYYADTQQFTAALEHLLQMDKEQQQNIAVKARQYVKDNYSWQAILQKFDKAIAYVNKHN